MVQPRVVSSSSAVVLWYVVLEYLLVGWWRWRVDGTWVWVWVTRTTLASRLPCEKKKYGLQRDGAKEREREGEGER
jgi:hypothetical protein